MRISVRVKPNSRQDKVDKADDGSLVVHVKAPAIENRANEAVITLLSEHFDISKRKIAISRGRRGKYKIIDIAF